MILYNATCIHDIYMIYHDISWWIMVNQIWYTPTLIRFWLPSPSLAHWNWHHIKVLAELVGPPAAPSRLGENPVRKCSPGRSGIHRNGWKIIRNWWHMVNYGDMVMQCIRNHCTKNWLWILSNAPVDRSNSGTTWLLELIQSLGRPSDAKSLGGPPWSPWFGRGHGQHESNSASNHNKPHEGELDELWAMSSHISLWNHFCHCKRHQKTIPSAQTSAQRTVQPAVGPVFVTGHMGKPPWKAKTATIHQKVHRWNPDWLISLMILWGFHLFQRIQEQNCPETMLMLFILEDFQGAKHRLHEPSQLQFAVLIVHFPVGWFEQHHTLERDRNKVLATTNCGLMEVQPPKMSRIHGWSWHHVAGYMCCRVLKTH